MSSGREPIVGPPHAGIHYSDAYEKLVRDDDDLIGHLAYSFYKKHKKELAVGQKLARDDPRIVHYHHDLQDGRIATLRSYAEQRLNDYADKIAAQIMETEREVARTSEMLNIILEDSGQRKEDIVTEISKRTSLWKNVAIGVGSGFIFALILTAAQLIEWTNPLKEFIE